MEPNPRLVAFTTSKNNKNGAETSTRCLTARVISDSRCCFVSFCLADAKPSAY